MNATNQEILDSLILRYAETDDVHRLRNLYHQLIPDEHPSERDMVKTLSHILENLKSVSIIVAELDQEIVATCQIIVYDNLIRTPNKKAVIDSVVVDEPFRKKGIGTAMIKWAVVELKRRRCAVIYVSTSATRVAAPKLYRKAGFEDFGTTFYISDDD